MLGRMHPMPPSPPKRSVSINQVIPGDILLFRPSRQVWFVQELIKFTQALTPHTHGHYDTTHVALCYGKDQHGHPLIAHVHEKHDTMGYIQEKLEELFGRDDGDRPFLVFRHEDADVRDRTAFHAGHHCNHNMDLSWDLRTGIKSLFGFKKINPAEEIGIGIASLSQTICSKFAIDMLKRAHHHSQKIEYYPALHSTSSPKALEAFVYKSHLFHELCYLGEEPVDSIKSEIKAQIHRFLNRLDVKSKVKYEDAKERYELTLSVLDNHPDLDELSQCLVLIKSMLPIFKRSTSRWGLFNTTSSNALLDRARKMGIFQRDIDNFSLSTLSFTDSVNDNPIGLDNYMLSF